MGLQNRRLRSVLSLIVAVLMIGTISYLGVRTYQASHAASGPSIYVSPSAAKMQQGATLSVTIREDSGQQGVNSVQASMNYDSNMLQFVSMTEGGAFPVVAANSTNVPGIVRVGRANSDADVTGDKPVVTINFRVIGASGSGAVSFDKAYSFLVRSSDNKDILQNVSGGSYDVSPAPSTGVGPTMYINPASGSYNTGSTISATVRINTHDASVTTVEAAIGYPANLLQYTGVTEGGVFTTAQRTTAANGKVDIIRGLPGGSSGVTGDKPVITINFKVLASGSAPLAVTSSSAAYDNSGSGRNILDIAGSSGSDYTLVTAGGTGPAPSPSPGPAPAPSPDTTLGNKTSAITTPSQALTIGTSSNDGHIALTRGDDGSTLTELGGSVSLAPIIDESWFTRNPGDTISKVEYYLDGKLISTQKKAPYTYRFDTKTMRNGTYTMTVKTFLKSGSVDTRTEKLLVKNKVDLAYVLRNFMTSIVVVIVIIVTLAVVIWKLVIPRFNSGGDGTGGGFDHDALYGFGPNGSTDTPVAGDPTVVIPAGTDSPAAKPDARDNGPEMPKVSTAALTTAALPMTPMETILPPTPSAQPEIIHSSSTITPMASEAPVASSVPVSTIKPAAPKAPVANNIQPSSSPAPRAEASNKYVTSAQRPDFSAAPPATAATPAAAITAAAAPKSIPITFVDEAAPVSQTASQS